MTADAVAAHPPRHARRSARRPAPGRRRRQPPARGRGRRLRPGRGARRHPAGRRPGRAGGRPGDPSGSRTSPAAGCELVCVLGGDGTILRGAELSRGSGVPLLGVNLGHVGFLAEAEREDLDATVERIVARDYTVEERMALEVRAVRGRPPGVLSWALNEVTVEKASRERMLELTVEIDGRPLSTWGCDGIVMATPTGSTAYAFSAGRAGGLARRRGAAPRADQRARAVRPARGRRPPVPARRRGAPAHRRLRRGLVRRAARRRPATRRPNRGAALRASRCDWPGCRSGGFTDRLVEKFDLPVQGWRGAARRVLAEAAEGDAGPDVAAGETAS